MCSHCYNSNVTASTFSFSWKTLVVKQDDGYLPLFPVLKWHEFLLLDYYNYYFESNLAWRESGVQAS